MDALEHQAAWLPTGQPAAGLLLGRALFEKKLLASDQFRPASNAIRLVAGDFPPDPAAVARAEQRGLTREFFWDKVSR